MKSGKIVCKMQEAEAKAPIGLKDGNTKVLKCSACTKPLVNIWVTRPDEKVMINGVATIVEWNVQARCCYCGDYSFVEKVTGGFHQGGIFQTLNSTDDKPITIVDDIQINNTDVLFLVIEPK